MEWMGGCRERWSGWVDVWEWGARIGRKPNLAEHNNDGRTVV